MLIITGQTINIQEYRNAAKINLMEQITYHFIEIKEIYGSHNSKRIGTRRGVLLPFLRGAINERNKGYEVF